MWSFFKGWKRKLGAMTLLIACVVMAGFVRSYSNWDWIEYTSLEQKRSWIFISERSGLLLAIQGPTQSPPILPDGFTILSIPLDSGSPITAILVNWGSVENCYCYNWGLFNYARVLRPNGVHYTAVSVPYLSLLIPLTLLSAYLLLIKPPATVKQVAATPPIAGT